MRMEGGKMTIKKLQDTAFANAQAWVPSQEPEYRRCSCLLSVSVRGVGGG